MTVILLRIKSLFILLLLFCRLAEGQAYNKKNLTLWDNKPAKSWMTEAYPIGNGKLGAMIFGGVKSEHIQFNEISLWTGDEQETGAYQAFGDIYIDFDGDSAFSSYRRELDLNTAVYNIEYKRNNNVYQRTYFSSHPDQVLVADYTTKGNKAGYTATISIKDAHGAKITDQAGRLIINNQLSNGLKYAAMVAVKHNGGKVSIITEHGEQKIRLEKVNNFTLLLSAATNYLNQRNKNWQGQDPLPTVTKNIIAAYNKNVNVLKAAHTADYRRLFDRVSLQIGDYKDQNTVPTKERVANYKSSKDPNLETLLFQYGRYLLISSSRKGGLPANLQGLWNNSNNPPWRSDYHSNINIQMNYWLAEPVNLSESHIPYLEYINSMREVKKQNTQKEYPGVRGWTVKTENNIFGGESFSWNTPGSAWYAQAVWEHYAFTQNKTYLKNFAYPILKEITEFWDDHLKRRPDGTIVAPDGWSPEHGPTEDGVSYDQQIVYDLFTNYIEAADTLNIDQPYRSHIADLRAHLLKPKIGKWGQLQEWESDRDDPNDRHRHASHLFGLHPGRQFSVTQTPELAKAAKISLTARGDESTGWSMAWKMNFWARLQDGDHAYKILNNFITLVGSGDVNYDNGGGIYSNLLCAHPPFQIDGSLGYTAGIAEMLLQSQAGEIQVLPALPKAWTSGEVKGLKARGNFEIVQLTWKNNAIQKLVVKSLSGSKLNLLVPQALKGKLVFKKEKNLFRGTANTRVGEILEFVNE